jgi:hypothetical protein
VKPKENGEEWAQTGGKTDNKRAKYKQNSDLIQPGSVRSPARQTTALGISFRLVQSIQCGFDYFDGFLRYFWDFMMY